MFFTISIIIALITLILLLTMIQGWISDGNYQTSLLGCNRFFSGIEGKPAYFDNELKNYDPGLIEGISGNCPSKTFKITRDDVSNAARLIKDCWFKSAEGADIFAANLKGEGICLYCGTIKTSEEIPDFGALLKDELKNNKHSSLFKNDTEAVNLNPVFLEQLPASANKKRAIQVFYYTFKPDSPKVEDATFTNFLRESIGASFSKFVDGMGSYATTANYFASSSVIDSYSGVLVDTQASNEGKTLDDTKNIIDYRDCKVIIPDKNFD